MLVHALPALLVQIELVDGLGSALSQMWHGLVNGVSTLDGVLLRSLLVDLLRTLLEQLDLLQKALVQIVRAHPTFRLQQVVENGCLRNLTLMFAFPVGSVPTLVDGQLAHDAGAPHRAFPILESFLELLRHVVALNSLIELLLELSPCAADGPCQHQWAIKSYLHALATFFAILPVPSRGF